MLPGLRSVWALFMGVALVQFGNGLQGSLIGVLATEARFSEVVTGLISSAFYAGLLVSSLITPSVVARVGYIRVFAAYASLASTTVLLMPLWVEPGWWLVMRFAGGFCLAGLAIVAESWLNASADNTNRGQVLSIYMIIMYASTGLGQFLLNVTDTTGFSRFIIVSVLISVALVPTSLAQVTVPASEKPRPVGFGTLYTASPLAFMGTLACGLAQSVFFSLGPVYGLTQGLPLVYVSAMMALPTVAVIFSMYPIGLLSDRYDRRIVLMAIAVVSALLAGATAYVGGRSLMALIVMFSVFGAVSFPLYSLAMAHANDFLDRDQMLGASSKIVLIYGIGAVAGPVMAGGAMQAMGGVGFMIYMMGVFGLLGAFAFYRMGRRPELPDESVEMIQVGPSMTPVVAAAIAEEVGEGSPETDNSET